MIRKGQVFPPTGDVSLRVCSSQMAPGYAVAVMGIDFTLRYFYKVLLDLLPICNQDKGNKIRYERGGSGWSVSLLWIIPSPCYQFLFFDSFGIKKGFAEEELNFQIDEKKKGKEGRRDKLIITAFQLGMWCCCLSPHTFPSFMPPSIFCPPSSLIVPNSLLLSLLLLSVGVQQPYKSGLAP